MFDLIIGIPIKSYMANNVENTVTLIKNAT
jgi:hypothetical protein